MNDGLLELVGFRRGPCAFHGGECFSRPLSSDPDVAELAKAIGSSLAKFKTGARSLENCGLHIDQPEGWGFCGLIDHTVTTVHEIHFGSRPEDQEHFRNLAAEMWSKLRDWLKSGGAVEDNEQLLAELTSRGYGYDDNPSWIVPRPPRSSGQS